MSGRRVTIPEPRGRKSLQKRKTKEKALKQDKMLSIKSNEKSEKTNISQQTETISALRQRQKQRTCRSCKSTISSDDRTFPVSNVLFVYRIQNNVTTFQLHL